MNLIYICRSIGAGYLGGLERPLTYFEGLFVFATQLCGRRFLKMAGVFSAGEISVFVCENSGFTLIFLVNIVYKWTLLRFTYRLCVEEAEMAAADLFLIAVLRRL